MKMSKVGNQTNSQDPQAMNSRVFVGNLNTFQCSKTDVERMFQRYGRLVGISMHKGFAFIQFTNPFDARSACLGEDGRTVLGQTLDVNLVCEPKPHQIGRKRQNLSKTGNDWDYFYDSYYSAAFPTLEMVAAPPSSAKRARLMIKAPSRKQLATIIPMKTRRRQSPPQNNQLKQHQQTYQKQQQLQQQFQQSPPQQFQQSPPQQFQQSPQQHSQQQIQSYPEDQAILISQLKTYSNPDILICGNCREMFEEIADIAQHKKNYCKMRFTCKCNTSHNVNDKNSGNDKISLLCVQCKESFESAWDLLVHIQAAHMINIYELGVSTMSSPLKKSESHEYVTENGDLSDNEQIDQEDMGDDPMILDKPPTEMMGPKFHLGNSHIANDHEQRCTTFNQPINGRF